MQGRKDLFCKLKKVVTNFVVNKTKENREDEKKKEMPSNETNPKGGTNDSLSIDPGAADPGVVVGAAIGAFVVIVLLIVVIVVLVAYFVFPHRLVKWLQRLHLRISGLKRKSIISSKDGFEFHYAERGSPSPSDDEPSLLLIHGFSDDLNSWAAVVRQIPESVHCVALDLPGHGKSRVHERDDLSFSGFTRKLHEFVVAVGLEKVPGGIHVIGQSLGGAIAGNYGATYGRQDGVELVTLAGPAMKTPKNSEFWEALQNGEFEQWMLPDTPEGTHLMLSRSSNVDEKKLRRAHQLVKGVTTLRVPRNDDYRRVWTALEPEIKNAETIVAGWAGFERPTQIVWGTADRIIDISGSEVLVKVLPDARVDTLAGAGHNLNMDAPGDFARLLLEFREDKKKGLSGRAARDHLDTDADSNV